MHPNIEAIETTLGVDLSSIRAAAEKSQTCLAIVKETALDYLRKTNVIPAEIEPNDLPLGLVAFGSLGRSELTKGSDFDHGIVAYGNVESPTHIQHHRVAAVRAQRAAGLGDPGRSNLFGRVISTTDLVNRIGLDEDSNHNHTVRMLFLEESVAIVDETSHRKTIKAILRRYLYDYQNHVQDSPLHKFGVPRFLLNDVVRYWRTLAVDYQAKRWDELPTPMSEAQGAFTEQSGEASDELRHPKWGLRYIKLRSTRKIAFVGTIASLMLCGAVPDQQVTDDVLYTQFSMPPLARLAALLPHLDPDDQKSLGRIFEHVNWILGRLDDAQFRDEVNLVEHPRLVGTNAAFDEARQRTIDLEMELETLFESERPLTPRCEGAGGADG